MEKPYGGLGWLAEIPYLLYAIAKHRGFRANS
jgi:hypothetical protein